MYRIPLSKPSYTAYADEVCEAVNKVIRSGFIAQGKVTEEFEQRIAEYTGCRYTVAVSSGTAGLFLCLKACGIGPGDEVITTPFSFIASSNVIVHAGAKPVFVDIDRDTYNMDVRYKPALIDPRKTKAILPVDVFGNPIDTNYWLYGADKDNEDNYRYYPGIIIDSCESFGTKMSRPFDAAVYAFYPNKQLTTGEGGVIVTNNQSIAEYCQAQRNQGRKKGDQWLESSYIGYNYRMTDMQASMGLVQLDHWDEILKKRLHVYEGYLKKLPEKIIQYPKLNNSNNSLEMFSPFVFTVEVPNRDKVMQHMLSQGIECKPYFPAIHLQKPYRDMGYNEGMFPVAELVSSRTLALPFFTDMSESEVDFACSVLKDAIKETC
jgi:perosamine synthetase